jgi:CBS domain-containing protein
MSTDVNVFPANYLGSAIANSPLVVKTETSVMEAIALMSESLGIDITEVVRQLGLYWAVINEANLGGL